MSVASVRNDPDFATLKRLLLDRTGLEYYGDREEDLAQRIQRRLLSRNITRVKEYLALLRRPESDPEATQEWNALIDAVTIGETYFFRFPEQFDALQLHILPELLQSHSQDRTLNIWCAGCSNGAEPHTISILLQRDFGDLLRDWQVHVLGTDINQRFLQQARAGWYHSWSLRTLNEASRRVWFDYEASTRRYLIKPGFRRNLHFAAHNMIHAAPPRPASGRWNLIFCRNVLIYFDPPTIRQQILRFAESLEPGGYLFLGHAEPGQIAEMDQLFETVRLPGVILYRRRGTDRAVPVSRPIPFITSLPSPLPLETTPSSPIPWQPADLSELPRTATPPIASPPPTRAVASLEVIHASIRQLLDSGKAQEAAAQLESLLASPPSGTASPRHDPVLHYYHALALEQQEEWERAEAAIRRTLYLDRSFLLAHYHQALLAERRGDLTLAVRSLDTVTKLLLTAPDRLQSLQTIAGITPEEMAEVTRLKRATLENPV